MRYTPPPFGYTRAPRRGCYVVLTRNETFDVIVSYSVSAQGQLSVVWISDTKPLKESFFVCVEIGEGIPGVQRLYNLL